MSLDCTKLTNSKNWIQYRNKGQTVTQLQAILRQLGYYKNSVDGDFGPKTKAAVISFQNATKNTPDGKVGPATCKSINEKLTASNAAKSQVVGFDCTNIHLEKDKPNDAEYVKLLQTHLKTLGYYTSVNGKELKIDGTFGDYTKIAVKAFQKATGNTEDGWVGSKTCASLNKVIGATTTLEKQKEKENQAKQAAVKKATQEVVIDASKYQFLPEHLKGNFHIDDIHFISSSVEQSRGHNRGNWVTQEMMNHKLWTYEGANVPVEYDITCYLRYEDYKIIKPALALMIKKVCTCSGTGLITGKYVISYNIVPEGYRTWWKLTFHLLQYFQGGT